MERKREMVEYEMNWKGNKFSTISFSITERISVIFLEASGI